MGRHSATRSHGPVVVLAAAAVIGSAGLAWAVGIGPSGPETPVVTTSNPATATRGGAAPTPTPSARSVPVVVVVPAPTRTASTTRAGTGADPTTPATEPAPAPTAGVRLAPTRSKPGRGVVPTPHPTKPHK